MAYQLAPQNTASTYSAQSADSVRELWQATVDTAEQTSDFFQAFEGTGKDSLILTKTDFAMGKGATMTITVRAGYYGEGKSGSGNFEATADFEKDVIGSYQLSIDTLRNATSIDDRAEQQMGMKGELIKGSAPELGNWMGREKCWRLFMTFRYKGRSTNLKYAGGVDSIDALKSSHGLTWSEIVDAKAQLQPQGGRPAMVGVDSNKNPIYRYVVAATNTALATLKKDDDYKQMIREAGVRGDSNPMFKGGFADVDGNLIKEFTPIDHDGNGPIGSPLNPKALLGVAVTAGTTAIDIKGGGNATFAADTTKMFFKFFENYAYEFLPSDILTPETAVKYFLIVNPKSATAGEDGKIGMYSYTTGNNGNKITIVERLGSAASGARVTTLGDVTWDTGVWAGKHTDAHPVGSYILPCNSFGQVWGDSLILGANAALRGYGAERNRRDEEWVDGHFVLRRYIRTDFGQSLRKDASGRAPGYIRIRHAIDYPGLGLPTIE